MTTPNTKGLRKPCKRCNQKFIFNSRGERTCPSCKRKSILWKKRELSKIEKLPENYPLKIYKRSLRK